MAPIGNPAMIDVCILTWHMTAEIRGWARAAMVPLISSATRGTLCVAMYVVAMQYLANMMTGIATCIYKYINTHHKQVFMHITCTVYRYWLLIAHDHFKMVAG